MILDIHFCFATCRVIIMKFLQCTAGISSSSSKVFKRRKFLVCTEEIFCRHVGKDSSASYHLQKILFHVLSTH